MKLLRDIAGLLAALAMLILAFGFTGNLDYADALLMEAAEREARLQRRANAELLCQCLKVNRGRWLRIQVTHQPDRDFCRAVCYYEGDARTEGTL